jgi:hypothetical protein
MEEIGDFSVGRRWRVQRESISFDFVIIGPGSEPDRKLCQLEPLPGQAELFGEAHVMRFFATKEEFTHKHLREQARLLPISLDDIARSI